jgi:hypothetical protein
MISITRVCSGSIPSKVRMSILFDDLIGRAFNPEGAGSIHHIIVPLCKLGFYMLNNL